MLLKEKYPALQSQFDEELNKGIDFDELTTGSRLMVWWRCHEGSDHVWAASVNQRTSGAKLRGCPVCAGKKVVKSSSLGTLRADIAEEWHHERNSPLTPYEVTPASNKKVWWRCSKHSSHMWLASPKQRTRQSNVCPICNSLGYLFPAFAEQWHPTKNGRLTPFDVSYSAHTKVWWKCPEGFDHVWQASPNTRTSQNSGCPICAGYRVVKSNSLAVVYPELASQWCYERNVPLTPDNVYCRSTKKVWWKCPEGNDHVWSSRIKSRALGIGCPICSGRKVAKSNSLAERRPEVASLWHPSKNKELTPYNVTPLSSRMVWWKCPQGEDHEWNATVANVVSGSTCPVCMNRRITETNNVFALYEDLEKEWDFGTNKNVNPLKLSAGSKIKVWWICRRNAEHRWLASVRDRAKKDSGCPFCAMKLNVQETRMYEIIKSLFRPLEVRYRFKPRWLGRLELDVYVPEVRLGFEYQGAQHFRPIELFGGERAFVEQVKRDELKRRTCKKKGVSLIYAYYDERLSANLIRRKIEDAGLSLSRDICSGLADNPSS